MAQVHQLCLDSEFMRKEGYHIFFFSRKFVTTNCDHQTFRPSVPHSPWVFLGWSRDVCARQRCAPYYIDTYTKHFDIRATLRLIKPSKRKMRTEEGKRKEKRNQGLFPPTAGGRGGTRGALPALLEEVAERGAPAELDRSLRKADPKWKRGKTGE